MLALALLLALGLYAYESGNPKSSTPTPAQQDLLKLGSSNPTTYQAVVSLLGAPNPTRLIQYAAQLSAQYPALAAQMGDMAVKLTKNVTGKSGTTWTTWSPQQGIVEVMLGTMPVLRYVPKGTSGNAADVLTSKATDVDSSTYAKARSDFNL